MDPLLIDVPERIETERPRAAQPAARRRGHSSTPRSGASLDELGPWLPWAGSMPERRRVRGAPAAASRRKFMLREDFVFLIFAREAGGQEGELRRGYRPASDRLGAARASRSATGARPAAKGRGFVTEAVQRAGAARLRCARRAPRRDPHGRQQRAQLEASPSAPASPSRRCCASTPRTPARRAAQHAGLRPRAGRRGAVRAWPV